MGLPRTRALSCIIFCAAFALPLSASATARIYLTATGTHSWTVPSDWNNANNTIEVIGGGGGGGGFNDWSPGGGAYSKCTNVTLTAGANVNYSVGAGSTGVTSGSADGGDTYFNATSLANAVSNGASVSCGAQGGQGTNHISQPVGGQASAGVGAVKYSGGTGADSIASSAGAGGGGAAGPLGAGGGAVNGGTTAASGGGGNGGGGAGSGPATNVGGNGGDNQGGTGHGTGGANGAPGTAGTNGGGGGGSGASGGTGGAGGAGTEWDASHGSGGGGGGGASASSADGGPGGLYGGAGGSGSGSGKGGDGAQGIIVITYTPLHATFTRPPNNLGLVGYWSLDEGSGTTATDFSGSGYTGTITGTPNWVNGRFGKALNFDASSNYIDLGNPTAMRQDDCTVSAWVKTPPAADNDENLLGISKGAASTDSFTIELGTNASNNISNELIYVSHVGSDFSEEAYATTNRTELFDNRWHHVVVTEDTSTHIYLDGVSKTVTTVNTDTGVCMGDVNLNTFRIGNLRWAGSNINFFDGIIDDVRIYNRALSSSEIAALYQRQGAAHVGNAKMLQQGTTLTNGLVGYWTFDGPDMTWSSDTVGTSTDRSGNGNDGTLTSMNRKTSVDGGALGQALTFDGSGSFIDLGKPSSLSLTGGISVSAWIKPNATTCAGYCDIVANYDSGGLTAQYELTVHSGTLVFDAASSGTYENDTSTFSLSPGVWYHVVAVRDAANTATQIYVNGSATTVNRVGSVTVPSAGFGRTAIGRAGDFTGQYFPGIIDDVRIYSRALSAAEVKQLYQLGKVKLR